MQLVPSSLTENVTELHYIIIMTTIKITNIEVNDDSNPKYIPTEMTLILNLENLETNEEIEELLDEVMFDILGYGTNSTYTLVG